MVENGEREKESERARERLHNSRKRLQKQTSSICPESQTVLNVERQWIGEEQ
jgi:hypothetical protein